MSPLAFQPIDLNAAILTLHGQGWTLADVALATDQTKEVVRGRGRRMNLSWGGGPKANGPTVGAFYRLHDAARERLHREADNRLLKALAAAFQRGDHLPDRRAAA